MPTFYGFGNIPQAPRPWLEKLTIFKSLSERFAALFIFYIKKTAESLGRFFSNLISRLTSFKHKGFRYRNFTLGGFWEPDAADQINHTVGHGLVSQSIA